MKNIARPLAALALAAGLAASCQPQPAVAAPANVGAPSGAATGARLSLPIGCTKTGTLWTCREGTTGNVVAQLQDYASCVVESDCRWEYIPGPGQHAADTRWFLTGVD